MRWNSISLMNFQLASICWHWYRYSMPLTESIYMNIEVCMCEFMCTSSCLYTIHFVFFVLVIPNSTHLKSEHRRYRLVNILQIMHIFCLVYNRIHGIRKTVHKHTYTHAAFTHSLRIFMNEIAWYLVYVYTSASA